MPLVRTELAEGHSHTVDLPPQAPSERSAFFTSTDEDHGHTVIYGGNVGPGLIETEEAGFEWGDDPVGHPVPEAADPDRPHTHVLQILA